MKVVTKEKIETIIIAKDKRELQLLQETLTEFESAAKCYAISIDQMDVLCELIQVAKIETVFLTQHENECAGAYEIACAIIPPSVKIAILKPKVWDASTVLAAFQQPVTSYLPRPQPTAWVGFRQK